MGSDANEKAKKEAQVKKEDQVKSNDKPLFLAIILALVLLLGLSVFLNSQKERQMTEKLNKAMEELSSCVEFQRRVESATLDDWAKQCSRGNIARIEPSESRLRWENKRIELDIPGLEPFNIAVSEKDGRLDDVLKILKQVGPRLAQLNLRDGDIVFDVGAHVGVFAIVVSKLFPNVRVVCFEPVPGHYHLLQQNLLSNNANAQVLTTNTALTMHGNPVSVIDDGGNEQTDPARVCVPSTHALKAFETYLGHKEKVALMWFDCGGCEREIASSGLPKVKQVFVVKREGWEASQTASVVDGRPGKDVDLALWVKRSKVLLGEPV